MKNIQLASLLLLLAGALFTLPTMTNSAHAQLQGTVCITPLGSTSCPSSPPTITANVGTQLKVSIFLQGSDATNGFDITLSTDHTVLKPAGANISGTILPGPQTILVECIGGVLRQGNVCSSTDTVNTIHLAVSSAPGTTTGSPATGLLFTATFNVTGAGNRVPLGYQSGCPAPTSAPGTCITIANGTPTPDGENGYGAFFTNSGFTGIVCILPASSTACPGGAATLTGTVGAQVRAAIFIQGSAGTNGFDVTLVADHTILKPAGADITGTLLLGPPQIIEECIGGVLVQGNVCSSTDTIDTIHFAAVSAPGSALTTAPTTGLLFTAIYNVTGSTGGTNMGFQMGCNAPTSVSGLCITIANGTPTPDPEFESPSTFTSTGPTGSVCIVPSGSTSCPSTSPTITAAAGSQIRLAVFVQSSLGTNGFDITLLADHTILKPAGVDFTGTVLPGPQTILVECIGTVEVAGTGGCSSRDTVDTIQLALGACPGPGCSTTTPTTGLLFTAIYNVTSATAGTAVGYQTGCASPTSVSGTCITLANGGSPDPENALGATFSTPADFAISANPSALTLSRGRTGTSAITISSLAGFAGAVSISASLIPVNHHGPAATLSPISISLASGGTGVSTLTVSTQRSTASGTYTITIKGTSGTISHTVTVTITVQ